MPAQRYAETITYQQIKTEFAKIPINQLNETTLFINGDHWQGGKGWIGYWPKDGTKSYEDECKSIKSNFTPKNVIGGMVNRLTGAIMGKEPKYTVRSNEENLDPDSLTPNQKFFNNLDALLVDWWSSKNILEQFKTFVHNRAGFGKTGMRIVIPDGYLNDDGTLGTTDLKEILNKIYIDIPTYSSMVSVKDKHYGDEFYICCFEDENKKEVYDITYVNNQGETVIRQVNENGDANISYGSVANIQEREQRKQYSEGITTYTNQNDLLDEENNNISKPFSVNLGGSNLCFMHGDYSKALITDPVKRQQKMVNHAKTMEGYAMLNINFPYTIFLNAEMEVEKKNEQTGVVEKRLIDIFKTPGTFLSIFGVNAKRSDLSDDIKEPKVHERSPADPQKFATVADNNTRDMHQEAGMLYIYLLDSEYASGDSKVKSMTDYLILLTSNETLTNTLGVWMFTTIVRLVLFFAGRMDLASKFKVDFKTIITLGPISNEDKTAMQAEYELGLRDRESYMQTADVTDDPAPMIVKIDADKAKKAAQELEKETALAKINQPNPKSTGASA